jgi:hypothetical protein
MDFLAALLVSACVFDQILWHEIIRIAFLYPLVTNEKTFLNELKGKETLAGGVAGGWIISSLQPTVLFLFWKSVVKQQSY